METIVWNELLAQFVYQHADSYTDIVLLNHFVGNWEADLLIINEAGISSEFEFKRSKSDFKNDFKKCYKPSAKSKEKIFKHDKIEAGDYFANYFSFVMPKNMVALHDVPEHLGVIVFEEDEATGLWKFETMRTAKLIQEDTFYSMIPLPSLVVELSKKLCHYKIKTGNYEV